MGKFLQSSGCVNWTVLVRVQIHISGLQKYIDLNGTILESFVSVSYNLAHILWAPVMDHFSTFWGFYKKKKNWLSALTTEPVQKTPSCDYFLTDVFPSFRMIHISSIVYIVDSCLTRVFGSKISGSHGRSPKKKSYFWKSG